MPTPSHSPTASELAHRMGQFPRLDSRWIVAQKMVEALAELDQDASAHGLASVQREASCAAYRIFRAVQS